MLWLPLWRLVDCINWNWFKVIPKVSGSGSPCAFVKGWDRNKCFFPPLMSWVSIHDRIWSLRMVQLYIQHPHGTLVGSCWWTFMAKKRTNSPTVWLCISVFGENASPRPHVIASRRAQKCSLDHLEVLISHGVPLSRVLSPCPGNLPVLLKNRRSGGVTNRGPYKVSVLVPSEIQTIYGQGWALESGDSMLRHLFIIL